MNRRRRLAPALVLGAAAFLFLPATGCGPFRLHLDGHRHHHGHHHSVHHHDHHPHVVVRRRCR